MVNEEKRKPESEEGKEADAPDIIEEIEVEDFAVDGICGVY